MIAAIKIAAIKIAVAVNHLWPGITGQHQAYLVDNTKGQGLL